MASWIDFKKQEPEKSGDVWVCAGNQVKLAYWSEGRADLPSDPEFDAYRGRGLNEIEAIMWGQQPTHWMPVERPQPAILDIAGPKA